MLTPQHWSSTLLLVTIVLRASPLVGQFPVFVNGMAGASFDVDERDPASGGGFSFLTGVGLRLRRVAFGAEFGQHALGGDRQAKQYGAFLRLAATSGRRIEPYVIVGVADYRYSPAAGTRTRAVGGSLGPGLGLSLIDPNVCIMLEGRYHTSLDRIGTISNQEFMAVALGFEFRL